MKLSQLLRDVPYVECAPAKDVEITSLGCDSRSVQAGGLFAALPGTKFDGQDYIRQAVAQGAAAVLCRKAPDTPGPWVVVPQVREAFALLCRSWFDYPEKELCLLGVTGTNGKTTTTYLLKAVLEQCLGARVGLIGTNQNLIGGETLPAFRTTPESYELYALLRRMADAGCSHVVMEVSSHALDQRRTHGLCFRAGIFTNLTQDHLDYHGTMEAYRTAKARLFCQCQTGILNLDDAAGAAFAREAKQRVLTYSENKPEADVLAKNIHLLPRAVRFEALTVGQIARVSLPVPGGFSIYNALGVLACALELGIPLEKAAAALESAPGVPGRIEVVETPAPYTVLIDYAHTPDALEKILTAAREFTQGKLICLFGCGGDRDRSKRPLMGAVAAALADVIVLTSDNPRSEEPEAIMQDVMQGIGKDGARLYCELDRRRAIAQALSLGAAGDVILLAGKGHETYQEIGGERRHFDEREEVAACFFGQEKTLA